MKHVRVASCQYFIRPVEHFSQFYDQVKGLVDTAAGHRCRLLVLPEYFTIQLLTLGDTSRPDMEKVRSLSGYVDRFVEMMSGLAKASGLYIVAGSIPVMEGDDGTVYNDCFFFSPSGGHAVQGKLHITRWEVEDWQVSPRSKLRVFETQLGRLAIAICYDVEFPEIVRAAAHEGVDILCVPSCTDDRTGFLRVRYCAQARCIENQIYVIHASTVGSLPMVPSVSLNYGSASILTPCDFPFARDGIIAEGLHNQETMVIGDLDMEAIHHSRTFGTVLPLNDSKRSKQLAADPELVRL